MGIAEVSRGIAQEGDRRIRLFIPLTLLVAFTGLWTYFGKLPDAGWPSFDHYATWSLWRREPPETVIFIDPEPRQHNAAYFLDRALIPLDYAVWTVAELQAQPAPLQIAGPWVAVYPAVLHETLQPWLPPSGNSVPYAGASGALEGYLFASGTPPASLDSGRLRGIISLVQTPVSLILALLSAALLWSAISGFWEVGHRNKASH